MFSSQCHNSLVFVFNDNNGRVAFIGIVIHNHFVLPMSLFIGLTIRFPNREASSEQFSAVLPGSYKKINEKKKLQQEIGNSKNIRTLQYLHYYAQKH